MGLVQTGVVQMGSGVKEDDSFFSQPSPCNAMHISVIA